MSATPPTANLVEAARNGDPEALERLLAHYQDRVLRFGLRMCGDRADAEDVLQDTLIAAARKIRDFRGASSLSTWLYKIAHSFCIKHRRKQRVADGTPGVAPGSETDAPPQRSPHELMEDRELGKALERAIAQLEPEYREVLLLRDVEGLTAPEVAEVLALTTDAVKSRLHRARVSVRQSLSPFVGRAEPPGPGCPDVLTQYSHHLEGDISATLCRDLEAHLDECPRCATTCDSLKRTLALCNAAPTVPVPKEIQDAVRAAVRSGIAGIRA